MKTEDIKNGEKMELFDKINITRHFIERYAQRILKIDTDCEYTILKDKVLSDMVQRMNSIEKRCFKLLSLSGRVKLPLGKISVVVMDNHTLITVY